MKDYADRAQQIVDANPNLLHILPKLVRQALLDIGLAINKEGVISQCEFLGRAYGKEAALKLLQETSDNLPEKFEENPDK